MVKPTYQIAREYREHCKALPKGKPGTIGADYDYSVEFDLEHLSLWLAKHVTHESPWWSKPHEPEFIKISRRVMAFCRRHGWAHPAGRRGCHEWKGKAP